MQKALFPMKYLRVTQGENGSYSHKGSLALDLGGKDTGVDKIYAPCDMKVVRVQTDSSHQTYTESVEPVLWADGTTDYVSFTWMHDNYLNSNLKVGAVLKQGEYFFDEGGFGSGRVNAFSSHLHLEVSRGKSLAKQVKNAQGTWCTPNQVSAYKVLFLPSDCTVLNSGGYTWIKDNGVIPTPTPAPNPNFKYDYTPVLQPVQYFKYCIDISQHQGAFNAQTAKNAGITGVICRANYADRKDTKFDTFSKSVSDVGLAVGAYYFANWHYSTVSGTYDIAKQNAIYQTNCFLEVIKSAPITSFVALDMEYESGYNTILSKAQLTELSNMCMDMMKAAGYTPLLYANYDWIFNKLVTNDIKYPLWMAYYYRYGTPTDFKDGNAGYFPNNNYGKNMVSIEDRIYLWQFTSEGYGSKYGVGSTGLDKNYAYMDLFVSKQDPITSPEPTPIEPVEPPIIDEQEYLLKSFGDKNMQGFFTTDVNSDIIYNHMPNGYRIVTGVLKNVSSDNYTWIELVDERDGEIIYTPLISDRNQLIDDLPFLGD